MSTWTSGEGPEHGVRAGRAFDPAQPDFDNTPASALRPTRRFAPADPAAPPAVTIVTPFFDAGEVFHETAVSVFRQTLQQWEWLLVDDGSTSPAALALLDEYAARDPRIRVVRHTRNLGLSAARNTGFREARAELVFLLDADDLIEPTALEKLAWHLLSRPDSSFAGGWTVGFGAKRYLWRHGFHEGKAFLAENLVTATKLIRRSVHREVGGYDEGNRQGLEDWEWWIRAAARGRWGTSIEEPVDWYRRRDTGREHWVNVTQQDRLAAFRDGLARRHPGLAEQFPEVPAASQMIFGAASRALPLENRLAPGGPRLLFVVPHFELGGADKFNLDLVRQLQRRHGWEVTVVATRRSAHPWLPAFEALTPDVLALSRFLPATAYPLFLRYLVESRQPDAVLVSNSLFGYQVAPFLRAVRPELPILDYLHMEEEAWIGGGYPRLSLETRSELTGTLVSSAHLKAWMVERGGDAGAIEVVTTNVDPQAWRRDGVDLAAARARWGVDGARPVILHAGRICEQKQPHVLAEVVRRVAAQHPDFTLLVAGDGPDLPGLRALCERDRLRQVRFLGAVPGEAMPGLLALADLFFLPSRQEGISLAIYEAMAMGVVPVGARVGGQAELVTPETGVLVDRGPGEVEAYVAALLRLLRAPAERRRLAAGARRRIEAHFRLDAMGDALHRHLLGARSRTGRLPAPMSREAASLHAVSVSDALWTAERADLVHGSARQGLATVRHELLWRPPLAAGQALAAAGLTGQALLLFDQAIQAAPFPEQPEAELLARHEIARGLVPFAPERAATLLEGSLEAFGRLRGPAARATMAGFVEKLRALAAARAAVVAQGAAASGAPAGQPLVSVVIPCFKQAHFLPEAVASVIDQTYPAWELVIVDDGSPDDTAEVAARLAARHADRVIRLVRQENRGLPAARNAGIQVARGEYVLPLDADDRLAPTFLARLVPVLLARPQVGFAYTDIQHFGARDSLHPLPDFDRAKLVAEDNIVCVSSLFRRAAWEQVKGYDETMREGYEDWDFWLRLVESGLEGHCLHEPLFFYRKAESSMLRDANRKRVRLVAKLILAHPRLYDAATRAAAEAALAREDAAPSP